MVCGAFVLRREYIYKSFWGVHSLNDVHIAVSSGENYALLDKNAIRNSKPIKLVAGVYRNNSGEICPYPEPLGFATCCESRPGRLGTISQQRCVFRDFSITKDLTAVANPGTRDALIGTPMAVGRSRDQSSFASSSILLLTPACPA